MTASTEIPEARLVDLATATPRELMALSSAAHWNQADADWQLMLRLGHGWGLRVGETLVASTLVLPYENRFAWVSMVLVLPAWRGSGFAARLLRVALDDLARRRLRPVLDATPAGRPVYLKQGFVDGWGFTRWRRTRGGAAVAASTESGPASRSVNPRTRQMSSADFAGIEALDAPAFGADRSPLLRALAARWPGAGWVAEGEAGLRGYTLGREGRTAMQLGPLVAGDDEAAAALLQAALPTLLSAAEARGCDVIADLLDGHVAAAEALRKRGFAVERPFTRMVHAEPAARRWVPPGDARRVFFVAGPELG